MYCFLSMFILCSLWAHLSYLGSIIINDAKWRREIKSKIFMAKASFSKKRALVSSKLDSQFKEES